MISICCADMFVCHSQMLCLPYVNLSHYHSLFVPFCDINSVSVSFIFIVNALVREVILQLCPALELTCGELSWREEDTVCDVLTVSYMKKKNIHCIDILGIRIHCGLLQSFWESFSRQKAYLWLSALLAGS